MSGSLTKVPKLEEDMKTYSEGLYVRTYEKPIAYLTVAADLKRLIDLETPPVFHAFIVVGTTFVSFGPKGLIARKLKEKDLQNAKLLSIGLTTKVEPQLKPFLAILKAEKYRNGLYDVAYLNCLDLVIDISLFCAIGVSSKILELNRFAKNLNFIYRLLINKILEFEASKEGDDGDQDGGASGGSGSSGAQQALLPSSAGNVEQALLPSSASQTGNVEQAAREVPTPLQPALQELQEVVKQLVVLIEAAANDYDVE